MLGSLFSCSWWLTGFWSPVSTPFAAHDRGEESSRVESGNETSEDEMDAEEEEDALHYEMEEEEKKVSHIPIRIW